MFALQCTFELSTKFLAIAILNITYVQCHNSEIYDETLNRRALRLPKAVDELIIGEEQTELLYKAIAALPEIQRRRFLLYYEYEYNYYEIAAMEHCTASSVGQSINRAKEKIKAQMKKYLCA